MNTPGANMKPPEKATYTRTSLPQPPLAVNRRLGQCIRIVPSADTDRVMKLLGFTRKGQQEELSL